MVSRKKNSLTIYITTIAYMVMLSVISQGLQIYIQAIFSWGLLLGKFFFIFFWQDFSAIKILLNSSVVYQKREIVDIS